MSPRKRRILYIYEFDSNTLKIEALASMSTKPLTDHEWNKVRKERLRGLKNVCWTERFFL